MKSFFIICICAFLFLNSDAASELSEDCYSQGVISLKAEHFTIVLKDDLRGFIFDTSANRYSNNPAGKFENLKIDSLIFRDSVVAYNDSLYKNLYAIHSQGLLKIMADINARKLARLVLKTDPIDVIEWVEVRQEWVIFNDMSKYYGLYFSPDSDEIRIADCISKIPDIKSSQADYRPCCENKPDSVVTISANPPVFDSNQSSFTYQELLDAAYGEYRNPPIDDSLWAGQQNRGYLDNWSILPDDERSGKKRAMLCTSSLDTVKLWIEKGVLEDSTHGYVLDSILKKEKYFEYFIADAMNPQANTLGRIQNASYYDNCGTGWGKPFYGTIYGDSSNIDSFGVYRSGLYSDEACREFILYYYANVRFHRGEKTLSFYKNPEKPCSYIQYYIILSYGDYCIYDHIYLFKNIYNIDTLSGLVTVERAFLNQYNGLFYDYNWPDVK